VQFPPGAADLVAAIGRLLDEQVIESVPPHLQHPVRVAGHLAHLVERELRLGPVNDARERELLADLLGEEVDDPAAALAQRIRAGVGDDFEARAWAALVEITRQDLAVVKPGHDSWEGE
jgi:Domain of unknown function (DUF6285)